MEMTDETLLEDTPQARADGPETRRAGLAIRVAGVVALIAAAVAALVYYLHGRAYESTDNAFIEGSVIQVSPRVGGQVIRVQVEDNQHVHKGDLIAEIDPRDFASRAAEAQARLKDYSARSEGAQSNLRVTSTVTEAALTQATAASDASQEQIQILDARAAQDLASIRAAEAHVRQAEAQQSAAAAEARRADDDATRYRTLHAKDEVSRQQLDRAETQARAADAALEAARGATEAAKANLALVQAVQPSTQAARRQAEKLAIQAQGRVSEVKAGPQQVRAREADAAALRAQVDQYRASLDQAELALSYTKIYAPEAGYITRKSVEPGMFVQPGQPLAALVSDRVWVTANYKETQLAHIRPGQAATLKLDAFPQLRLRGHVESIQNGTGARFSLLPAENATGNYVKVVQRVPVKIVLDEAPPAGYRIGPGMSVTPEIKVQ